MYSLWLCIIIGLLVILVNINKRVYSIDTLVCRFETQFGLLLQYAS